MNIDEKIIFLENDIEKLNLAIYKQDKKILELEKFIKILHRSIQENAIDSSNDLPPHY